MSLHTAWLPRGRLDRAPSVPLHYRQVLHPMLLVCQTPEPEPLLFFFQLPSLTPLRTRSGDFCQVWFLHHVAMFERQTREITHTKVFNNSVVRWNYEAFQKQREGDRYSSMLVVTDWLLSWSANTGAGCYCTQSTSLVSRSGWTRNQGFI